jgi:hypothetical protein
MIYVIFGCFVAYVLASYFMSGVLRPSDGPAYIAKQLLGGLAAVLLSVAGACFCGLIFWAVLFVLIPALNTN